MSETVTVYRVENERRLGPYQGSMVRSIMRLSFSVCPVPYEDEILGPVWDELVECGTNHEYIFGFVSMEQLEDWFYTQETRDDLIRAGFRVSVYKVPAKYVYIGATQVIFHRAVGHNLIEVKDIPEVNKATQKVPGFALEDYWR